VPLGSSLEELFTGTYIFEIGSKLAGSVPARCLKVLNGFCMRYVQALSRKCLEVASKLQALNLKTLDAFFR
jgi:hypothetical protein